jgi:hypothetical protein
MCANNDSDDEDDFSRVGYNDSDEDDCGEVRYDGDGVDKKMPAKQAAPINLVRNISFNTAPRAEEKTFVNLLDCISPNPKIISKEYQAECIQN